MTTTFTIYLKVADLLPVLLHTISNTKTRILWFHWQRKIAHKIITTQCPVHKTKRKMFFNKENPIKVPLQIFLLLA